MWHKIAPKLAQDYTVVCPGLRGYGDSGKVPGDPEHANYSKRTMALDQVEVMKHLGFDSFLFSWGNTLSASLVRSNLQG